MKHIVIIAVYLFKLVKNIVATNVLNLLKSFIINVFGILPVIFVAVKNDIILETLDLNKNLVYAQNPLSPMMDLTTTTTWQQGSRSFCGSTSINCGHNLLFLFYMSFP